MLSLSNMSYSLKVKRPGYIFETSANTNLHLSLMHRGAMTVTLSDRGPHRQQVGDVLVIRPGTAVRIASEHGCAFLHIAVRDGDFPAAIASGWQAADAACLCTGRQLGEEFRNREPIGLRDLLFPVLARQIVRARLRQQQATSPTNAVGWSELLARRIEESLYDPRSIAELMAECDPSPRQLARYFRAQFACSPKRYFLRARLEEAKRLLCEEDLSITTVAMDLHFASSQHFTAQFRQEVGMAPSVWRATRARETT